MRNDVQELNLVDSLNKRQLWRQSVSASSTMNYGHGKKADTLQVQVPLDVLARKFQTADDIYAMTTLKQLRIHGGRSSLSRAGTTVPR